MSDSTTKQDTKPAGHTPGPWAWSVGGTEIRAVRDGHEIAVGQALDPTYGVFTASAPVLTWEEVQANARLIAAAPDLYEALKGWLPIAERQLDRLPEESRISTAYGFARERIGRSQAAIDKAEGRTS